MSYDEVAGFMSSRNIPLGDPDFVFGNLPDSRMILSQGINIRFESSDPG